MGLSPIPFVMIPEVSPAYVSPIEQPEHICKLSLKYRPSHPCPLWPFRLIVGLHSYSSRSLWLMLDHRDSEFLRRTYFPSDTQFFIRRRYVEGRQSVLHFRRCSIVVDVVPVQIVQIVGYLNI